MAFFLPWLVISIWKALKHFHVAAPSSSFRPLSFFNFFFFFFFPSSTNLWSKRLQFFLITVVLGQNGKPDQNRINWLEFASQVSPMPPLIQSALTLLPPHPPGIHTHTHTLPISSKHHSFPTGVCICIYSFTHSFTLDFHQIIPFTAPPPHPQPSPLHHPPHYPLISWNLFATSARAEMRCPSNLYQVYNTSSLRLIKSQLNPSQIFVFPPRLFDLTSSAADPAFTAAFLNPATAHCPAI